MKQTVKKLKQFLQKNREIIDIILFGSFVKGKGNVSDIDIALLSETVLNRTQIKKKLEIIELFKLLKQETQEKILASDEKFQQEMLDYFTEQQKTLDGEMQKFQKFLKDANHEFIQYIQTKTHEYETSLNQKEMAKVEQQMNEAIAKN